MVPRMVQVSVVADTYIRSGLLRPSRCCLQSAPLLSSLPPSTPRDDDKWSRAEQDRVETSEVRRFSGVMSWVGGKGTSVIDKLVHARVTRR